MSVGQTSAATIGGCRITRESKMENAAAQWDPCFLGGQGQYFSDRQKIFSDKPKIFPDDNILMTISDNIDNFPTISNNIDNFPTGLNNRGGGHAPCHDATAAAVKAMEYFEALYVERWLQGKGSSKVKALPWQRPFDGKGPSMAKAL